MSAAPVVVIGAGIGGLACALRLAARGVDVLVLERAATVGGKLREVGIDGARLDAGPTVLTMRWVFDDLFADADLRVDDHLRLVRAQTLARHAWADGSRLDLYADIERSAEAIAAFAGRREADGYRAFCERARSIYRTLEGPFLKSTQPNPVSLAQRVGLRGLGDLVRISPFATMWSELSTYFQDPRLRQLFGRYATYCGSSPFLAPATLMLVAHVEQDGVWLVDGGMQRIAGALAAAIAARGGRVRCEAPVATIEVERGRACGVVLEDGERIAASAIVFNGDTAALAGGLLGDETRRAVASTVPAQRSLSAITWHLRARTGGFPLMRHNVFFGGDSPREFDELFGERRLPSDPTVYVCAQDRDDASTGTLHEPERLMCLVNAPADADARPLSPEEIERCETRMWQKLAACGLQVERPGSPVVTTPTDFARLFPATGGALYGRATHGWAASFARPSSKSRTPGLFLAGGSVHPGPGLPMAALSGRLAAESVLADRANRTPRVSTSTWRPAATSGGTSTR
jgi:1-hydroxycarotenoid 3,4-desaturase